MLNFLQPGTYVQPHVHPAAGQTETVHVLRGEIGFILFSSNGQIRETLRLGAGAVGMIDIEHGVWHGMVCLAPDTVILEIKMGPYNVETDKSFAPWAPTEADPECGAYLESLEALFATG